MVKVNKVQAGHLVKQAKALAAQHAANDAERAYNLDTAIAMARKADQLHGPYSVWDWNDRADKLVKDLQAARAKINVAATRPNPPQRIAANGGNRGPRPDNPYATQPNRGSQSANPYATQANRGPQPTDPYAPAPNRSAQRIPATDLRKSSAIKLLQEGRALADQGNFAAAKTRFLEADKLRANFAPNEYNPGIALRDLRVRGEGAKNRLVSNAGIQRPERLRPSQCRSRASRPHRGHARTLRQAGGRREGGAVRDVSGPVRQAAAHPRRRDRRPGIPATRWPRWSGREARL